MWHDNFFEDLTDAQMDDILSRCTELQKKELREIAKKVPCGILPIVGAAGTGKTTVTIRLLRAALLRGKTALVCSSTNAAVNNIARRAAAEKWQQWSSYRTKQARTTTE
jgi:signal recognition particle GTPase